MIDVFTGESQFGHYWMVQGPRKRDLIQFLDVSAMTRNDTQLCELLCGDET